VFYAQTGDEDHNTEEGKPVNNVDAISSDYPEEMKALKSDEE